MCIHCLLPFLILTPSSQESALRFIPQADPTRVEVAALLPKNIVNQVSAGRLTQEEGERWLQLCLVTGAKEGPPMLGTYHRDGQKLIFVPRFPLQNDSIYRASLLDGGKKIEAVSYSVPPRPPAPAAEVVAVWPANDILPANQLRFYIQFSRPMRGGSDIFSQIHILDGDGKVVADPWLPDELWSDDGTLLTLYIHPGRIKWGVLLRLLLGPVLEPDHTYTLHITGDMLDADGRRLAREYQKKFRTTAEDRTRLELSAWKLLAPHTGQRGPLTLTFPRALDSRGLQRFVTVIDAQGKPLAGKIEVSRDARTWTFQPDRAWTAQDYTIEVDRGLEDVAGNNPIHPFDVDADAPPPPPQRLSLAFRPLN
jgi:Bacterial Ig-like domain